MSSRAGVRWNPLQGQPVTVLPACWLSINCIRRSNYFSQTVDAKAYGHSVFWLYGAESAPKPYRSVSDADYVKALATSLETDISMLLPEERPDLIGGHNESIVDWYNRDGVGANLPLVKAIDTALWAVCRKYGIKYAITSTLCHNWTWAGGNNGWSWLKEHLYANDDEVQGDVIDIHAYTNTDDGPLMLQELIASWVHDSGFKKPFFIGEFGMAIGDNIPIVDELQAVTAYTQVMAACYFCLQDFGDPSKQYGLLRQDGSAKPAYQAFIDYLNQQGAETPEEIPVAITPTVIPYKIPLIPKPNDLIIVVNGQDGNGCVGDPDGNNEYTAGRWMLENKLMQLAEKAPFNFSYIFTPLEVAQKTPYAVGIPATIKACFAYAKARPTRHFDIVSWHTDSTLNGDDPTNGHYGLMAGNEKGRVLGLIWQKHFKPVYGGNARYLTTAYYPEYYALGQDAGEIPANVTLLLAETGVHGAATPWKWYRDHVDAIAKAAIDAESEALAVATPAPTIDAERIAELEQEVDYWKGKYQTAAGQLVNIKEWSTALVQLATTIQGEASGR